MPPLGFSALSSIVGLVFAVVVGTFYYRWFRRIPTLTAFTADERRLLTLQLAAITAWTVAGLSVFFLSVWSRVTFDGLRSGPGNLIVAAVNLALFGFVAITSITRRVTMLTAVRLAGEPAQGTTAMVYGLALLALLAFATWQVLSLTP